ncbi:bifunctional (p)ppGpp synthetase/guanosine-3',5'-bis(diphosphate) 3'-pyrophosphohydrolase [Candidatus Peregrinibacteria bacterium]|nr:MAG: bifunctional (p)ppGpp synthetase/guanosine-3',5'-bis(diphosphate) 3'-pyrophosphohydrolase [Candidatus Peregrinibacteria bacterium]
MNIPALIEHLFKDKKRKNGAPYTSHFYAVRDILMEAGVDDQDTLDAALLHDVLEDTSLSKAYIKFKFGAEVTSIVEFLSKWERWKTSHCKMKGNLDDMEVIWKHYPESTLIKMADRLHNLQTIDGFKPEKQREYIHETKDLLLPLFRMSIKKNALEKFNAPMQKILQRLEQEVFAIEKRLSLSQEK